MAQLPTRPGDSGAPPERRLSSQQMEAVIRRAVELQAQAATSDAEEGISEAELLRIGREIGVSPQLMQRALAETVGAAPAPRTTADRLLGPTRVAASRTVPGDADAVRAHLDRYLTRREWLAPVRRFPDFTVYEKARGGDLARALAEVQNVFGGGTQPPVGAGYKLRSARRVEAVVQQLEPGYSHVGLSADLGSTRAGALAGGAVGGGVAGTAVAVVLGIAVDPVAALAGLPVLAGPLWGARALYHNTVERAQLHLESILDALERGEPLLTERARR